MAVIVRAMRDIAQDADRHSRQHPQLGLTHLRLFQSGLKTVSVHIVDLRTPHKRNCAQGVVLD